jgi:hypothetical protein
MAEYGLVPTLLKELRGKLPRERELRTPRRMKVRRDQLVGSGLDRI